MAGAGAKEAAAAAPEVAGATRAASVAAGQAENSLGALQALFNGPALSPPGRAALAAALTREGLL